MFGALSSTPDQGETASPLQLDYYRQKIVEFQNVLVQMDTTAEGLQGLLDLQIDDQQLNSDINALLAEYDLKKASFRTAAEGLNLAINSVNYLGAGFPVVKVPSGLNALPPLLIYSGIAAGLAVIAGLVVWGRDWIANSHELAQRKQILDAMPDAASKAAVARELMKIDGAVRELDASPLGSIAQIVKYVAIAGLIYFGLQSFKSMKA
ncbi:MAG: hypothetical protein EBU92_12875 [Betaproteobacteria bacterium]|nr:hypothetical protein [Betaproteobacteria bacterium]